MEEYGNRKLEVGGEALKLDDLGPIIINTDGTTRRISNWSEMTKQEQESSWRMISARNKKRIEELKQSHIAIASERDNESNQVGEVLQIEDSTS